jgi:hypothetical protein
MIQHSRPDPVVRSGPKVVHAVDRAEISDILAGGIVSGGVENGMGQLQ